MNFLKRTLVVLIFGTLILSSCKEQKKEVFFIKAGNPDGKISIGNLQGNIYTNSYFGLNINFPQNLHPLDNEAKLKLTKVEQDIIDKGFDSDDLLENVKDMIPLVFAYDKVEVFENDKVASFIMMAQKIDDSNKDVLSSASEYLRITEKGLKNSYNDMGFNEKYTITSSEPVMINEKEFQVMRVEVNLSDGLYMYQDFYVIYVNGYAVFATTTYYNDEQKEKTKQAINSIGFN